MNHHQAVTRTGLSELWSPKDIVPVADIVFVHGLQGHPRKTWAIASPRPRPTKSKQTSKLRLRAPWRTQRPEERVQEGVADLALHDRGADRSDSSGGNGSDMFWPAHLLPHDQRDCRILTWGYNTVVTSGWAAANKNNLFAHARDFLHTLEREREPGRPIVFVAHSLGGILVKEVLRRSEISRDPAIQDILFSTAGVVFLGTPHRGSPGLASLAQIVRSTASKVLRVDSNATILRTLGVDGPELELSNESFVRQWSELNFRVKTFLEAHGVSGINISILNEKVVPDWSSLLGDPRENAESIASNHMDMARFSGPNDPGYRKVSGELRLIIQSIPLRYMQRIQSRPITTVARPSILLNGPLQPVAEALRDFSPEAVECLQKLGFAQLGSRLSNIHTETEGTCQWIFSDPTYLQWRHRISIENHTGLFWIKGKPGSGKSVLMKKILLTIEEQEKPAGVVASFFFNARGGDLERCTMGMYRSLIQQIITQNPDFRRHFVTAYVGRCRLIGKNWEWQQSELQDFLLSTVSRLTKTAMYVHIDALDECEESEVRDIANYLRVLTDRAFLAGSKLNVLISSRRYPAITIPRCLEIDVEKGNGSDIETYVHSKLAIGPTRLYLGTLERTICSKASKVFLWAVLVVEMIQQGHDSGMRFNEIEALISEIPTEVGALFEQLASTLTAEERRESCLLFQWVLLGIMQSLDLGSLHYGLLFGAKKYASFAALHHAEGALDDYAFCRRITHLSRGLIEVVRINTPEEADRFAIQVIHESVRDWFFYRHGLEKFSNALSENPVGNSHVALVETCMTILMCSDFTILHPQRTKHSTGGDTRKVGLSWVDREPPGGIIPNLGLGTTVGNITWYCMNFIFHHARAAEDAGVLPLVLLSSFASRSHKLWSTIMSSETNDEGLLYHSPSLSPVTLLCRRGFTSSIIHLATNPETAENNVITFNSVKAALAGPWVNTFRILCIHWPVHEMRDSNQASVLHWILDSLRVASPSEARLKEEFLDIALENGACVNEVDGENKSTLISIAQTGRYQIARGVQREVKWLLDRGVDVNGADRRGRTALHEMVLFSNPLYNKSEWASIFQLLLDHGAEPNVQDENGQTALYFAASKGTRTYVSTLLGGGADIGLANTEGATPLHAAALAGHYLVLNDLITKGGDPNRQDIYGDTPLHIAAKRAAESVLEFMLSRGANPSIRNRMGLTAQDHAEAHNQPNGVVQLLQPPVIPLLTIGCDESNTDLMLAG